MSAADDLVKQMGLENAPNYYFVSHASADNPQIRPIIIALLDAGIPLWFDKPEKIDVALKRCVGKVPSGVDYDVALDVALAEARGCLWFPTEAFQASNECKRERDLATFLSNQAGSDYKIIPIFITDDAFKHLDDRNRKKHGTDLFVEPNGEGYKLVDHHAVAISNFCEEVKSYLVGYTRNENNERIIGYGWKSSRSGADGQDVRSRRRADADKVSFRVDRQSQRRNIRRAFSRIDIPGAGTKLSKESQKYPVIICHGKEADVSRQFTKTTLVSRVIGEYKEYFKPSKESENEITPFLDWVTHRFVSQEKFDETFCEDLAGKFQVSDGRSRKGPTTESLAAAFKKNKVTRLIVSRMNLSNSDVATMKFTDLRRKIDAWVNFWSTFPLHASVNNSLFTMLPVLDIVYPDRVPRSRNFFGSKPTPEKFERLFSDENSEHELTPAGGNIMVHVLDKFEPIKESMVDSWIDEDGLIFQKVADARKERLREELKELVATPDGLPMREWADGAENILQNVLA